MRRENHRPLERFPLPHVSRYVLPLSCRISHHHAQSYMQQDAAIRNDRATLTIRISCATMHVQPLYEAARRNPNLSVSTHSGTGLAKAAATFIRSHYWSHIS